MGRRSGCRPVSSSGPTADSTSRRPSCTRCSTAASDYELVEPGEWTLGRIQIPAFAHAFRAGSAIRITINTPGGDTARWEFELDGPGAEATHVIGTGVGHQSSVVLPILKGLDVPTPLPACNSLRGQPCRTAPPVENVVVDGDFCSLLLCPLPATLGGARPSDYLLPSDYDPAEEYPLLVVLHGFGANGPIQSLYMGVNPRVDERDVIVLTPNGTLNSSGQRYWSTGASCCGDPVDDVGYLSSLIEEAQATFNIDEDRVYLWGHSNGGFMAYTMACERGELVTAIVSLAGSSFADAADCGPRSEPVSVLQVHGDADATVPYTDSASPREPRRCSPATAGSSVAISRRREPGRRSTSSSTSPAETTVRYHESGCAPGTSVELWTIEEALTSPASAPRSRRTCSTGCWPSRADAAPIAWSGMDRPTTALLTDHYELTMVASALQSGIADRRSVFEVFARRLPAGRVLRRGRRHRPGARRGPAVPVRRRDDRTPARAGGDRRRSDGRLAPVLPVHRRHHGLRRGRAVLPVLAGADRHRHVRGVRRAGDRRVVGPQPRLCGRLGGRPDGRRGRGPAADRGWVAADRPRVGGRGGPGVARRRVRHHLEPRGRSAPRDPHRGHHRPCLRPRPPLEAEAFAAQRDALGVASTYLVDTFDVLEGIRRAVEVVGPDIGGVRIDSGELLADSRAARALLDQLGATECRIVVSSDLDEFRVAELEAAGAPIDAYLVGTSLVTGSGHPTAQMVYKLVSIADDAGPDARLRAVGKLSPGKRTVGGRKDVHRTLDFDGRYQSEVLSVLPVELPDDSMSPQVPLVLDGQVVADLTDPREARARCFERRSHLRPEDRTPWPATTPAIPTVWEGVEEPLSAAVTNGAREETT
ncbi:MAG: PHB depolymerase family esterase [Acidimicrobiales bacterium]